MHCSTVAQLLPKQVSPLGKKEASQLGRNKHSRHQQEDVSYRVAHPLKRSVQTLYNNLKQQISNIITHSTTPDQLLVHMSLPFWISRQGAVSI